MPYAVITGSANGIGASVRRRLEGQGFTVIGVDLRDQEVSADLSTKAGRDTAIKGVLDMTDQKIDRLVLAAGLGGHIEDGALVARVNFFGAVQLLDGLKEAMAAAEGRGVVIGSNSAQMRTNPDSPMVQAMLEGDEEKTIEIIGDFHAAMVYPHSKHALTRAVRRRAAELGQQGIRMNVIAPGPTETAMLQGVREHPTFSQSLKAIPVPQGRFGEVEEITDVIEFLLSDAASHVHGSVLYVDGGSDAQIRSDSF